MDFMWPYFVWLPLPYFVWPLLCTTLLCMTNFDTSLDFMWLYFVWPDIYMTLTLYDPYFVRLWNQYYLAVGIASLGESSLLMKAATVCSFCSRTTSIVTLHIFTWEQGTTDPGWYDTPHLVVALRTWKYQTGNDDEFGKQFQPLPTACMLLLL